MDKDGDGAIDYEEWRDFLVVSFLDNLHGTQNHDPAEHPGLILKRKKVAPLPSNFFFQGKFFSAGMRCTRHAQTTEIDTTGDLLLNGAMV